MVKLLVFNRARFFWLIFMSFFFLACALEPLGFLLEKLAILILGLYGILKINVKKAPWEIIWVSLCLYVMLQSIYLDNLIGCLYALLFLFSYFMGCAIFRLRHQSLDMLYLVKVIAWLQCFYVVFGIIEFLFAQQGINVFYRDYFLDPYRADSFYTNPNPFSVVSILLILMLSSIGAKWNNNKVTYILLTIGTLLGGAAISFLCVIIYLGVRRVRTSPLLVMLALIFCIFFPFLIEKNDLVLALYNKRVQIWDVALSMLTQSKLVGIGFGVFQKTNFLFEGGVGPQYGLHSMYYAFLIESGYIGFGLLMVFMYSFLRRLWLLNSTFYPVFVALLFSQLTEFYLDHEEIFMLLFAVCLAASLVSSKTSNRDFNYE